MQVLGRRRDSLHWFDWSRAHHISDESTNLFVTSVTYLIDNTDAVTEESYTQEGMKNLLPAVLRKAR